MVLFYLLVIVSIHIDKMLQSLTFCDANTGVTGFMFIKRAYIAKYSLVHVFIEYFSLINGIVRCIRSPILSSRY